MDAFETPRGTPVTPGGGGGGGGVVVHKVSCVLWWYT